MCRVPVPHLTSKGANCPSKIVTTMPLVQDRTGLDAPQRIRPIAKEMSGNRPRLIESMPCSAEEALQLVQRLGSATSRNTLIFRSQEVALDDDDNDLTCISIPVLYDGKRYGISACFDAKRKKCISVSTTSFAM